MMMSCLFPASGLSGNELWGVGLISPKYPPFNLSHSKCDNNNKTKKNPKILFKCCVRVQQLSFPLTAASSALHGRPCQATNLVRCSKPSSQPLKCGGHHVASQMCSSHVTHDLLAPFCLQHRGELISQFSGRSLLSQ